MQDPDAVRKCKVRLSVLLGALLACVDLGTDIYVLYFVFVNLSKPSSEHGVDLKACNFWECLKLAQKRAIFLAAGILFLILSQIVSVIVYVCKSPSVTLRGVFLNLIGLGVVQEALAIWRNPVLPPWDLNSESCEEGTKMWKLYIYVRVVESTFEAAPFAVLQCGLLVATEEYGLCIVLSTFISFVTTGIPVADFIRLRCVDISIPDINFVEKFIITLCWSFDLLVRLLPVTYVGVHSGLNDYWETFDETQENFYNMADVLSIYGGLIIVEVISVIYFYIGVRRDYYRDWKWLVIVTSSLTLLFCSYPKLSTVGSRWWLETFGRFSCSIVILFELWHRQIIDFWQVASFLAVTIVTGIFQIYLCYHIGSGIYTGRRSPDLITPPGRFAQYSNTHDSKLCGTETTTERGTQSRSTNHGEIVLHALSEYLKHGL